jgi:tetratricopeptide (TPR) repeat protein
LTARLVAAVAIGLTATNGSASAASPQLEESWRLCGQSDVDTSIEGCTAIIQSGTETGANLAAAYYNRGIAYRHKGQLDRAIEDYGQVIRLKPGDAEAFSNRGIAYDDDGQHVRAIQDYDRAIRLKPNYAEAYYNRGNAYHHKSHYDRAIQDERTVGLKPGDADDHAIQDYDRAIRLRPDYAEAFNNRGIVFYDKTQYDRAIQDYDQAIRLQPDLAEAFNNRSLAYYKQNQYDRALQDFDQTIRLKKNYGNALVSRGLGASEAPPRRGGG